MGATISARNVSLCCLPVVELCQDPVPAPFDSWTSAPWNPLNEVPLHQFLVPSVDEETKKRLAVLGNLVVPPQASLAAAVLSHVVQLHRAN